MAVKTFITNKGTDLLARSIANSQIITFSGAKIGTGEIAEVGGVPEDARLYEALKVYYADAMLSKATYEGNSTCKLSAQYTASGLITAIKIREIGIYADDPLSVEPILFAYTNLGEDYDTLFPADQASFYKFYDVALVFTTSNGVSVTITPSSIVPAADVRLVPVPNMLLRLNNDGKFPADITGNAATVGGTNLAGLALAGHRHDNAVPTGTGAKDGFMSSGDKKAHDTLVTRVDQALTTTSNPTFANLTVNGNISNATFL